MIARVRSVALLCASLVTLVALRANAQQDRGETPGASRSVDEQWVRARAYEASPAIAAARHQTRAVEADRAIAMRGLVPEVAVTARYTRLSSVPEEFRRVSVGVPGMMTPMGGEGDLVFPQLLDQFLLRATLTLPVSDLPLRLARYIEAAGARVDASRAEAEFASSRAVLEARVAYLGWLRARAAVRAAQSSMNALSEQRDDADRRVRAGTLPELQRLALDAQLASIRRQIASLEGSVASAEAGLRGALVLDDATALRPTDDALVPEPPARDEAQRAQPERRADVRSLDATLRALDAQRRAEIAGLAPSLAVVAGVDYAAPNQRAFFQTTLQPLATWDLTVQLAWSLSSVLTSEGNMRRFSAQRDALEAQRRALLVSVHVELTSALAEARAAHARIEAAGSALEAAETLARARRNAFRAGSATATEVTLAEADLLRARLELDDARLEARAARARIDHATGVAPLALTRRSPANSPSETPAE